MRSRHAVPTALGTLVFHDDGPANGPVALLWPSLFSDGQTSWGEQLSGLHQIGWRTLTVDPYGTGSSSSPRRLFTMEECASAAVQLLDHAGVQRAAVLGLSWGGFVALRIALKHPDRVLALVLSNTSARRMPWLARQRDKLLAGLIRVGIPGRLGMDAGRIIAKQMLSHHTIRHDPQLASQLADVINDLDPVGLSYAMRSVLADRTDIVGQLGRIGAPTLVIDGAGDRAFSRAHSRELADRIARTSLVVLPDAGHLTPREAATSTTDYITEFFAELNPQGKQPDNHNDTKGIHQ